MCASNCATKICYNAGMKQSSRQRKRGRPREPHKASWGEHINGLRRRGDGRWVIVETGKTFVEPDERQAVARFRRWEAEQAHQSVVEISVPMTAFESSAGVDAAIEGGASLDGYLDGSYGIGMKVAEPMLWTWVREQLIERPEYVAEQTGIPEVARLAALPKPEPSPALTEVGKLYQEKAQVKRPQRRQMEMFWDDFRKWLARHNVETLRQLTPSRVAEYGDHVHASGNSPKYIKNRFTSIRGVINFARKRGLHAGDVRHALDCCAVLSAPRSTKKHDPQPIERADFVKLLQHAGNPRMEAFLLCMLNLCMYPGETLNLDWNEVNLTKKTVVTSRSKTSVIRIGVLWDRTIKAIQAIQPRHPQAGTPVFISKRGSRWSPNTANTLFRRLRKKAGVPEAVKAEHCRDGAYTTAIEAGLDLTQAKLLAGHATGISDAYAQRRPTMVADAAAAIEKAYFG